MNNSDASLVVSNCTFTGNSATDRGGGMHNENTSLILTDCTFSGNSEVGGSYGGAAVSNEDSDVTATDCVFSGNTSEGNTTGKKYWEPSRRWKKLDATLQRLLAKRRDQTKTFLYTLANRLFQEYDLVAIGNYTPRGGGLSSSMRRSMNNRSLIGRFKQVLRWVGRKSG